MISLTTHLKDFFHTYLRQQRGLSPNTIKSYRDTFKLLLQYLQAQRRKSGPVDVIELDVKTILAFLQYLEDKTTGRGNLPQTRNHRLLAIQCFFKYLSLHQPALENHCKRISGIPLKRADEPVMDFLNRQELENVLAQPQMNSSDGIRDLAILNFLYNTGARASEVADARLSWFDMPNRLVNITGKGNKTRQMPLWPATVRLLKLYLDRHRRTPKAICSSYFFINQRGLSFTRFGIRAIVKRYVQRAAQRCPSLARKHISTHNLRHTTASHLRESSVDQTLIKSWLGHKRLSSSDRYVKTDLAHKRKILERFAPPHYVTSLENDDKPGSQAKLLDWLEEL